MINKYVFFIVVFSLLAIPGYADWSGNNVWNGPAQGSPSGVTNTLMGNSIHMGSNPDGYRIMNITKDASSTASSAMIWAYIGSWEILYYCTYVGNVCTFSNDTFDALLNASMDYYIVSNSSYTRTTAGASYPYVSTDFNVTHGVIDGWSCPSCSWTNISEVFDLEQIVTQNNTAAAPANGTACVIYVNGNSSDQSFDNATELNMTASINNTLNVSVLVNGTVYNTSETAAENFTTFATIGIYNITANYTGNDTFSGCQDDLTLNITAYVAPVIPEANYSFTYIVDLNDAPLTCLNSTHAYRETYINGARLNETYLCPNDCDEQSNTGCNPAEYEQNIYNIIIVIVIIAGLAVLYKFGRSR